MKVTEEMNKRWEPFKELGDQAEIARLLKKHPSTVSRIMGGKEETKVSVIAKIEKFYAGKKTLISQLTETE